MSETATRYDRFRQHSARAITAGVAVVALAAGFAGGRATLMASSPPNAPTPAHGVVAGGAPLATAASYSAVVDRVAPAVVTIRVEKKVASSRTASPTRCASSSGRSSAPILEDTVRVDSGRAW